MNSQHKNESQQNIVGALRSNSEFSELSNAIEKAGLTSSLDSTKEYTVFAPTNEAFSKLPTGTMSRLLEPEHKDELADLVNHHLLSGRKTTTDVGRWKTASTLQGKAEPILVSQGKLSIAGANITQPDIIAKNGMIHGIDQVIIPGSKL